tara:strand:+ start:780 stop:1382 length:603 start_codon:yes stop_codon:yes gene_type:complete
MKNRLNIFSNNNIKNFLNTIFSQYELVFRKLETIKYNSKISQGNIIIINNNKEIDLVDFKSLGENYLIISGLNNENLNSDSSLKLLKTPAPVNLIKNRIDNFVQNLKFQFHDISIENEKLTNLKNKSFCYLTKSELDILTFLISEKETSKDHIKENILKIKSDVETNSLESHLTRIRKKMNKIKTIVKIQTKSDKLLITT